MDIEIVIFDPHYWIFSLGVSLNRYEQHDNKEKWVKKELDIGLLIFSIRFSWIFNKTKMES
jgi:hypothetical protein